MSSAPPITVLMPVYNGAEYLAEAIDSILAQTFTDFEFLIINDGSKDDSQAILERYAARDVRIRLVQQANMGLAATLNKGMAMAKGGLIARQDQDDISAPRRLERQLAWMDTHPECLLLGTHARIWTDRTPTERVHAHPMLDSVLKLDLLFNNPFVHSSVMLRRDAVLALGGYTTDRTRQPPEDYELWARIGRAGRVANLAEPLLVYREAAQSMSRTGTNPFQSKLVLLSAENLAITSGLAEADRHCTDIAALFHQAHHLRSSSPDLAGMDAVLQRCYERIGAEVQSAQERREFQARYAYWSRNLRHHWSVATWQGPVLDPSGWRARPFTGTLPERPEITVLMPVYDGAAHVADAIETILGQTLDAFEFLIINDGSRDGTQAILESYAARDPRIRVIQQENMGLAATLNRGLQLARGEFVARQDHDDLSAPERLQKQLAWMRAHPECVLLGTRAAISVDRQPTERAHDHPASNAALKVDLLFDNPFVHSSVMLRRERVLALGGYTTDPQRQPPEDYELWARVGRVAGIANLPERLLVYREVPHSMSRTGENPFRARLARLCAENVALAAGLPVADRHCTDIAAVLHRAASLRSTRPKLGAMQKVLQRCFDAIGREVASDEERREFDARCHYWTATLRQRYLHQAIPGWAQPAAAAGYRGARRVLRKIRALAGRVVR